MRNAYNIWAGKPGRKRLPGDLGVDGNNIIINI
jgi:hypothetical protein